MRKYITEILDEINADPKTIVNHKDNAVLRIIFEYAFDPEKKFILPDGDPPYKQDPAPLGMSPGNIYQEVKRFYIFCRADLKPFRRETLFVQLLENIHPIEAKMMLAIKDQKLHKLYPKITHKLVFDAGFITVHPISKKAPAKKSIAPESGAEV